MPAAKAKAVHAPKAKLSTDDELGAALADFLPHTKSSKERRVFEALAAKFPAPAPAQPAQPVRTTSAAPATAAPSSK